MNVVFVSRNDEALKYVIDVKTGSSLHETEIKTFPEDDENNGRHHEAIEKYRSENEDPNHPLFYKGSLQIVDSPSKIITSLVKCCDCDLICVARS